MAAVFVVDLPCANMRVLAVARAEDVSDAAAFLAVARMAEAIVATRAELARSTLGVDGEHVGMLGQHPARWGRRGRAHNDI